MFNEVFAKYFKHKTMILKKQNKKTKKTSTTCHFELIINS